MKTAFRSTTGKIHAAGANNVVNCNGRKMNGHPVSLEMVQKADESHFCKKCFMGGMHEAVFLAEKLSK